MTGDNTLKPCQYIGCNNKADVHVKRASTDLCGEHYVLNILRMESVLEYVPLHNEVTPWDEYIAGDKPSRSEK